MAADQFDSPVQHTTMSPPIDPGAMGSSTPAPTWHKPIGIIAIIVGSLGVLNGCWGTVAPKVMTMMAPNLPSEMTGQFDVMNDFSGWTIASSLAGLLVALALLVAGIGVLRQRRWGVTAIQAWGAVKIPLVVGSSILAYQVFQQTAVTMSQTQGMQAMPPGFMAAIGVA